MTEQKPTTWEWRAGYDYATEKYKKELDRLRAELKDRNDVIDSLHTAMAEMSKAMGER